MKKKIIFVSLILFLTTCGMLTDSESEIDTPFTANAILPLVQIPLPPLRTSDNTVIETSYCSSNGSGGFSDEIRINMGRENGYVWSEGGACIFRPLREAWAVTHNQPLMVWDKIDSAHFTLHPNPPTGVSHFYEIKYFVDDIIDVDWTMYWYHSIRDGVMATPYQILINYKKVKGTRYISYWEGSIILHQVTPTVTAITMRDQISASRTDPQNSADAIRDVIQKLRTGDPNWGPIGGTPSNIVKKKKSQTLAKSRAP